LNKFNLSLDFKFYQVLMSFGSRLLEARKKKSISQEELAKYLSTKGPVIGRYERDEMKPSIEVAAKMADFLNVSLDYLVGAADEQLDKTTLKRVLEIQRLPADIQEKVFYFIDMSIRDAKAKQVYS
ncbi:MAG: helix-turn-helix transcriptional regulator, partial [Bacteroidota bacterium]